MLCDFPADIIRLLFDEYFTNDTKIVLAKTNKAHHRYLYNYYFGDHYRYPERIILETPLFSLFNVSDPFGLCLKNDAAIPRYYYSGQKVFEATQVKNCYRLDFNFLELVKMQSFERVEPGVYRFKTGVSEASIMGMCMKSNDKINFFKKPKELLPPTEDKQYCCNIL